MVVAVALRARPRGTRTVAAFGGDEGVAGVESGEAADEAEDGGSVHRHEILVAEEEELLALEDAERVEEADGVE